MVPSNMRSTERYIDNFNLVFSLVIQDLKVLYNLLGSGSSHARS